MKRSPASRPRPGPEVRKGCGARMLTRLFSGALLGCVGCTGHNAALQAQTAEVWSGEEPDFLTGDISSDGRYFSDIDWETGDLRIVELETGEAWGLTGEGYSAGRYAWTSAFSTDGRRLAVSWYVYEVGSHELRVMNVDGTGSRVLVPADPDVMYVDPLDWSPSDDRILVALRGADLAWQLGLVSLADGSVQVLKTLGWLAPGGEQTYPRAWFSPDGKYVGYDYRPELDERARSIYALSVDGAGEAELVGGRAVHRLLGWMPGGRGILFSTSRGETSEVWKLPVRDGRSDGEPVLVHSGVRALSPLGFTPAGYAYGAPDENLQVHTAPLNSHIGQILGPPRTVEDPPFHTSLAGDWSPDGSHLAYVAQSPQPNAIETLVVRTEAGEVVRRIPLDPTIHTSSATFRWIADELIVLFAMEKGRNSILRLDPRTGTSSRFPERVTHGAGNLKFFEVGPDARELYFVLPPSGNHGMREIVARDAETGEQRAIVTARADPRTLAVSPAGDRLAYIARDDAGRFELRTSATAGADEVRTLYRASPGQGLSFPVAWVPDASRILFVIAQPDGDRALWSVATDGRDEPVRLEASSWCCAAPHLRIDPNGRRITTVAGRDRGSIRLLEGF